MFESCDLTAGTDQWSWLVPLIIVIVLSFFSKRLKPAEKTPNEIATALLMDVMNNERALEKFSTQKKPKKLSLGSWQRNSEKLDFLDPTAPEYHLQDLHPD